MANFSKCLAATRMGLPLSTPVFARLVRNSQEQKWRGRNATTSFRSRPLLQFFNSTGFPHACRRVIRAPYLENATMMQARLDGTPCGRTMQERFAQVPFKSLIAAALLLALRVLPASAHAPACGDLELEFKTKAPEAVSTELNVALFHAADAAVASIWHDDCWRPEPRSNPATVWATPRSLARLGPVTSRWFSSSLRKGRLSMRATLKVRPRSFDAAEMNGRRQSLPLLAKGANPDLPGRLRGLPQLTAAAFKGNGRIVERAHRRGAPISTSWMRPVRRPSPMRRPGNLPLGSCGCCLTKVSMRSEALWQRSDRADVGPGHEDGVNTARGGVETVELLIDRGAHRVDAADNRGQTALMIAVGLGRAPAWS